MVWYLGDITENRLINIRLFLSCRLGLAIRLIGDQPPNVRVVSLVGSTCSGSEEANALNQIIGALMKGKANLVPEPSSVALGLIGFVGLWAARQGKLSGEVLKNTGSRNFRLLT